MPRETYSGHRKSGGFEFYVNKSLQEAILMAMLWYATHVNLKIMGYLIICLKMIEIFLINKVLAKRLFSSTIQQL